MRLSGKPVQNGATINYTNTGTEAIPVGKLVKLGLLFGVVQVTIAAGATEALAVTGVYSYPAAGTAGQGEPLYYDEAADELTADDASGANAPVGVAWADKAAGDTTAQVALNIFPPVT